MAFDWQGLLLGSQGDPNRNRYQDGNYIRTTAQQGIADVRNRQAPQAANTTIGQVRQLDQSAANQFRERQMGLANQLGRVASGQEKGAGEIAAQRQGQRALAQAQGAASMGRGYGASGARQAARAAGAIGLGTAGAASQAAMQDQANARGQLGSILGQGREQDLGAASQNMSAENQRIFQQAELNQATSLANMQARLQAMGMSDQAAIAYLQQIGAMNGAEMAARGQDNGIAGGLISGLGSLL